MIDAKPVESSRVPGLSTSRTSGGGYSDGGRLDASSERRVFANGERERKE